MRDIKSNLGIATSLAPATRNATANGTGVDLQGFNAAMVVLQVGAITDGTHTPKLQESDDNAAFTDVAAADLIGEFAQLAANTNQRVGYRGAKRYVRVVATVVPGATGGAYGALVVKGEPNHAPVA